MTDKKTVAVYGLGNMGYPIAQRLAGHFALAVSDLNEAQVARAGTELSAAPCDAAALARAHAVVLSLPSPSASLAVLRHVLPQLAPGTVVAPEVLDAPEVRCVIAGETHYEGRLLDDKSTYYIPEGVQTSPIESPKGAELLVFSLPMYAKAAWDKAHGRETVAA